MWLFSYPGYRSYLSPGSGMVSGIACCGCAVATGVGKCDAPVAGSRSSESTRTTMGMGLQIAGVNRHSVAITIGRIVTILDVQVSN